MSDAIYESCPHCHGSFSFSSRKEDGTCPWCGKFISMEGLPPYTPNVKEWERRDVPRKIITEFMSELGEYGIRLVDKDGEDRDVDELLFDYYNVDADAMKTEQAALDEYNKGKQEAKQEGK